jgi:TRAP-type C4-dicarboxylate transport system permease large subunit
MQRRGSHPGELSSLLATSSAMSETIPPSLVLITIGSVTPGLSIAALFTGGLMPALVAALALVVVAWWRSRHEDKGAGQRAPVSLMLRTFAIAVPGLTLPFVIRFAVIDGVATATEVSTVGVSTPRCSVSLSIASSIGGAYTRSWSTRYH